MEVLYRSAYWTRELDPQRGLFCTSSLVPPKRLRSSLALGRIGELIKRDRPKSSLIDLEALN